MIYNIKTLANTSTKPEETSYELFEFNVVADDDDEARAKGTLKYNVDYPYPLIWLIIAPDITYQLDDQNHYI